MHKKYIYDGDRASGNTKLKDKMWITQVRLGDEEEVSRDKIDRKEDRILLNKAFRSQLLLGEKGSPTDIPLIKMLLMFLVKEDFKKTKWSADRKKEIEYMNMVFISTLKFRR